MMYLNMAVSFLTPKMKDLEITLHLQYIALEELFETYLHVSFDWS